MVPELLGSALGVEVPAYTEVTIGDATLEQLAPTEVRADLVVELHATGGRPRLAIVVEVQLAIDPDKPFTWPAYLATLRLRLRCDVCLLVVTPNADVAAWASRAIRLGPGNEGFRVLVLGPQQVPVVTDVAVAAANPALATLALMAHGADPGGVDVLVATIVGLAQVDAENEQVYFTSSGRRSASRCARP